MPDLLADITAECAGVLLGRERAVARLSERERAVLPLRAAETLAAYIDEWGRATRTHTRYRCPNCLAASDLDVWSWTEIGSGHYDGAQGGRLTAPEHFAHCPACGRRCDEYDVHEVECCTECGEVEPDAEHDCIPADDDLDGMCPADFGTDAVNGANHAPTDETDTPHAPTLRAVAEAMRAQFYRYDIDCKGYVGDLRELADRLAPPAGDAA